MLDELEVLCCNGLDYIGNDGGKTQVGFNINRTKPYSSDEERTTMEHIVPFQIAYAVSIHKAQGLEYDSVKIVIADETEDQITHNIFLYSNHSSQATLDNILVARSVQSHFGAH